MRSTVNAAALGILLAAVSGSHAGAQSMTPMRGSVPSMADAFAVRVYPSNTYENRIQVEIHVYDQDFFEIPAEISAPRFALAGGASRQVTVVVPFGRSVERKVRICTESIPFPSQATKIRTQICGKFVGRRLAP